MANVKLLFFDKEEENNIQVYVNQHNEILVCINQEKDIHDNSGFIALDVDTAVKLSKELRKQIAILKPSNTQDYEKR